MYNARRLDRRLSHLKNMYEKEKVTKRPLVQRKPLAQALKIYASGKIRCWSNRFLQGKEKERPAHLVASTQVYFPGSIGIRAKRPGSPS
jgi:hypothetical protein